MTELTRDELEPLFFTTNTLSLNGKSIPYNIIWSSGDVMLIERRRRVHPLSERVYVLCHVESMNMIGKPFLTREDAYKGYELLQKAFNHTVLRFPSVMGKDHPHAKIIKDWIKQCYLNGYLTKE